MAPPNPMRKLRKFRIAVDRRRYSLPEKAEQCLNKLKNACRIVTRHDNTAESFLGSIDITSIRLLLCLFSTWPKKVRKVTSQIWSNKKFTISRQFGAEIFAHCVLFIIQPMLACYFSLAGMTLAPTRSTHRLRLYIMICAAYLSLINITKRPESDLAVYLGSLADAKYLDLRTFLIINHREPLYYTIQYLIGHFQIIGPAGFIIFSTLIPYMLLLFSVERVARLCDLPPKSTACVIILIAFMPQLFELSAHIMRQFIAASIVIFWVVPILEGKRVGKLLPWVAFFVHFSCMPIILLSATKPPPRRYRILWALIYMIFFALFLMTLTAVAPALKSLPGVGIIFERLTHPQGADLKPLGGMAIAVSLFSLFSSGSNLFNSHRSQLETWPLDVSVICISALVIFTNFIPEMSEISRRYFFYLYFLLGLNLVPLVKRHRILEVIVRASPFPMLFYFFYKIEGGVWHYASIYQIFSFQGWQFLQYANHLYM